MEELERWIFIVMEGSIFTYLFATPEDLEKYNSKSVNKVKKLVSEKLIYYPKEVGMLKDNFITYAFTKPMLELQQSIVGQICEELGVVNIKEYFTEHKVPKEIQNEILNPAGLNIVTNIDHSGLVNTPIFQLQKPNFNSNNGQI